MLPTSERDRRYAAIRGRMAEADIDTLLIAASSMRKGAIRYVSEHPIHFGESYCVFPLDAPPTLFTFSPLQTRKAEDAGWIEDVRTSAAYLPDLTERLRAVRPDGGEWTVGVVGTESFAVEVYNGLSAEVGAGFVETDLLDRERRVKSEAELELARRSAEIADEAFRRVRSVAEPGLNEFDLYAELKDVFYRNKVAYSFDLIGAGRQPSAQSLPADRTLEADDVVNVELTPAYEGYFTQLAFQLPLGEVSDALGAKERARRAAQAAGLERVEPGARADEIYAAMAAVVDDHGFEMPRRGGHCLGLQVNEQPVISPHVELPLEAGMLITVHPMVVDEVERAFFADTYVVTEDGYERLNEIRPERDLPTG